MTDEAATCFYMPVNGGFEPTALAVGPWDKRFQNGVALAGLIAHIVENEASAVPMAPVRLVIDIARPTPMGPIETHLRYLRNGKRMQLLDVELHVAGELTVRATALRLREQASPATDIVSHSLAPEGLPTFNGNRSAFAHILETRLEAGGLEQLGPGVLWARFRGEIVSGIAISPFVQMAMASDFGSGLSAFLDWREWTFANVDISLHLTRSPQGEWLRLASRADSAGNGIAIVDATLSDETGDFGHAHQTLFLDQRQK